MFLPEFSRHPLMLIISYNSRISLGICEILIYIMSNLHLFLYILRAWIILTGKNKKNSNKNLIRSHSDRSSLSIKSNTLLLVIRTLHLLLYLQGTFLVNHKKALMDFECHKRPFPQRQEKCKWALQELILQCNACAAGERWLWKSNTFVVPYRRNTQCINLQSWSLRQWQICKDI